jgi:hypothetical protein
VTSRRFLPQPDEIVAEAPDCHLCTWAFSAAKGGFWLKFVNASCRSHGSLLDR